MTPRLRPLLGSTALHAGIVCGLGVWVGAGAALGPRPEVRFGIAIERAPLVLVERVERLEEHVEAEHTVVEEHLPEPLIPPPDASRFEAPLGAPEPSPPVDRPPLVDPRVRIRPPRPEPAPPPTLPSLAEAELRDDDNAPPVYPPVSVARGEQGVIWLRLAIDASGAVADVVLEEGCGHARLHRAAIEAARRWRFEPARRDGLAVATEKRIPIEFRLE